MYLLTTKEKENQRVYTVVKTFYSSFLIPGSLPYRSSVFYLSLQSPRGRRGTKRWSLKDRGAHSIHVRQQPEIKRSAAVFIAAHLEISCLDVAIAIFNKSVNCFLFLPRFQKKKTTSKSSVTNDFARPA